jgi:hypothetical protein
VGQKEELISKFGQSSKKFQKAAGNLIGKILISLMNDKIRVDLELRERDFFFFDDDLVKDAFQDDEEANRKDGHYLHEQSFFVFFKSATVEGSWLIDRFYLFHQCA